MVLRDEVAKHGIRTPKGSSTHAATDDDDNQDDVGRHWIVSFAYPKNSDCSKSAPRAYLMPQFVIV